MKYFDDIYKMPIWNLIEIQRSINNGDAKYHYMIVGSEKDNFEIPKKYNKQEAKEAHDKILFQMPETDNKLLKRWAIYIGEVRRVQLDLEWNRHVDTLRRMGIKDYNFKKINHNRTNQAFGSYLNEFERGHTEFEFTMYGIIKDMREEWEKHYPNLEFPKVLKDKPELMFFLFEEYLDLLTDYEQEHGGLVDQVLKSETFIKVFIKPQTMKFATLRGIEKRMSRFFISINDADKWKSIRGDFLGLGRVKCKPKSDNTMIDEVIILRDIMNQPIDIKRTTVGELQRIKVQAKEKVRQSKDKNEKPSASG
jgi:hypothetical protein